jgi:hypothetical protein
MSMMTRKRALVTNCMGVFRQFPLSQAINQARGAFVQKQHHDVTLELISHRFTLQRKLPLRFLPWYLA